MRNNIAAVSSPISSDAPSRWASFYKLFLATVISLFLRKAVAFFAREVT
jgi:hypothetical protein